jgi:hypothetical protein
MTEDELDNWLRLAISPTTIELALELYLSKDFVQQSKMKDAYLLLLEAEYETNRDSDGTVLTHFITDRPYSTSSAIEFHWMQYRTYNLVMHYKGEWSFFQTLDDDLPNWNELTNVIPEEVEADCENFALWLKTIIKWQ